MGYIWKHLGFNYPYFKFYILAIYYQHCRRRWKYYNSKWLADTLRYAFTHSKYFRDKQRTNVINRQTSVSILQSLPTLSKDIIKKERWNIYSNEIDISYSNWRNTGGSTGEPLRFPALATKHYMEDICMMMLYRKMGYKWGDTIVAIDGSRVSLEQRSNNVFWNIRSNLPYGKLHYSTLYLDDSTFPYYLDSINKVKPKIMRGYPSGFLSFCRYVERNQSQLTRSVKGIYLTSENFSEMDAQLITSVFGCPVYGQYGHTECSVFAVKEPSSTLYLCSPLYGYTEVLDNSGMHVKEGECGEIVVTGFSIAGLPFIRYRTGDMAIYGGQTKYGETILTSLMGRTVDYIYDKNGNKVYLVGFIFGGHLSAFNVIKSWQIEQRIKGSLIVKIVKMKEYTQKDEYEILSFFEKGNFECNIKYVDDIALTQRGKKKFLIQKCLP